jgi:hypothetical protein
VNTERIDRIIAAINAIAAINTVLRHDVIDLLLTALMEELGIPLESE